MYYNNGLGSLGAGVWVAVIILYIVFIVAMWKVYRKAGVPGWTSIIPILNLVMLFKISWGRAVFVLLLLIPIVNIIIELVTMHKLSKAFGHGAGFTVGLIFLSPIFYLILGYGPSEYQGAK